MYKLRNLPLGGQDIICLANNACIPFDPANQDFVEYNKWLSEGNTPIPADE